MSKKIRKAIIPAAGLGTRFLPATKAQPKEMLPIVDKPTIQYIIEEAVASGIEEILIITGRSKKCIEDHFDKSVELELELEKSGKEGGFADHQDSCGTGDCGGDPGCGIRGNSDRREFQKILSVRESGIQSTGLYRQ